MNVSLPVMRWGGGERRALLVHGLTSSSRVWWRVASELADRGWDVTAVDLRGHGGAPPASRYPIPEMAGDLIATGASWDVAVGHSLGGAAVVVASHESGWADRLVLVEPVISIAGIDRADLERSLLDELHATEASLGAEHPTWHADDIFWKVWSARQCSPSVVRAVLADNDPWDVSADLRTVPVPTRVLRGVAELGAMVDADGVRAMIADNPRIEVEVVEGAGHSIFRDKPAAVVNAIVG